MSAVVPATEGRRARGWLAFVVAMVLLPCALGCDRERATEEQCRAIFDRLVELELSEMGFRDPELTRRRQSELRARHRDELEACVGRPLRSDAMRCVQAAESAEQLSHECLR